VVLDLIDNSFLSVPIYYVVRGAESFLYNVNVDGISCSKPCFSCRIQSFWEASMLNFEKGSPLTLLLGFYRAWGKEAEGEDGRFKSDAKFEPGRLEHTFTIPKEQRCTKCHHWRSGAQRADGL
jgi:hypothetical protein